MAEKRIGRRIKKTTCKCDVVMPDNSIQEMIVEVFGEKPPEKAQRAVVKILGTERVLVRSISYSSFYCSMAIEDFVKYGTIKP